MSTLTSSDMKTTGFLCGPRLYRFEDMFFEWHSYCGPWPLKKNGDPRACAGRAFWQMVDRFQKLTDAERAQYRVGGGCIPFVTVTA